MKLAGLILLALLAGCGQKGPLYFAPADESGAGSSPASEETREQDQSAGQTDDED